MHKRFRELDDFKSIQAWIRPFDQIRRPKSVCVLQGHRVEQAKAFTETVSRRSGEMLRLFDALVTVEDVKIGSMYRE